MFLFILEVKDMFKGEASVPKEVNIYVRPEGKNLWYIHKVVILPGKKMRLLREQRKY